MEGDLGPNVPGSSSAAQLSHELSGTVMSASRSPSPGDTKDTQVLGLLSQDCHLPLSGPVWKGRGATADLPPAPQERKRTLLGSCVKWLSFLTHPFGRMERDHGCKLGL